MKEKLLHTHSMLPRMYHQDDNYPEVFFRGYPLEEDFLTQARINIKEIENTYFLEVALPGFNNEDLQVYMDDYKLYIRALNKKRMRDEHSFLRKEFDCSMQIRTFLLPYNADPHRMITHYNNGILKITIFKMGNHSSLN